MTHSESRAKAKEISDYVRETECTLSEAAAKFCIPSSEVRRKLTAHGVRPVKEITLPSGNSFEILRLLLRGHGCTEISRLYAISKQRVQQIKDIAIAAGWTELASKKENARRLQRRLI